MRLTRLLPVAASATAFLLPPSISEADTDIIKTLPFENAIAIDSRILAISCPGCPVLTSLEGKTHVAQVDSMLSLNFSILHTPDSPDTLLLNNLPIYPFDGFHPTFMEPMTAAQKVKNKENVWEAVSNPVLGWSIAVSHGPSSEQDQLQLLSIHVEIMEVANTFLSSIPAIELKLLETPSGKLMIGDAVIVEAEKKEVGNEKECSTLLCKWRAIVADRLAAMKASLRAGCGKKPSAAVAAGKKHPRPGHGRHGGRPSRPYGHGHRKPHGGFAKFLRGVVFHVFIPVLVGILVGITASLVGMVVGHIVVFAWRLLFRRGDRGQYAKLEQVEEEVEATKEPEGPPPQYEDAVDENEKQ